MAKSATLGRQSFRNGGEPDPERDGQDDPRTRYLLGAGSGGFMDRTVLSPEPFRSVEGCARPPESAPEPRDPPLDVSFFGFDDELPLELVTPRSRPPNARPSQQGPRNSGSGDYTFPTNLAEDLVATGVGPGAPAGAAFQAVGEPEDIDPNPSPSRRSPVSRSDPERLKVETYGPDPWKGLPLARGGPRPFEGTPLAGGDTFSGPFAGPRMPTPAGRPTARAGDPAGRMPGRAR